MTISNAVTELSKQLTTTEQKIALNDLMHELHSRHLLPRHTIEIIWKQWAAEAASLPVRAGSATERATCPHTVHTAPDSLGSEGLIFPRTEDVDRVVPRDPRNPNNRRSHLLGSYGAALDLIEQRAPEAVQPIRNYVIALRDECARTRVKLRDMRTRLEEGSHE